MDTKKKELIGNFKNTGAEYGQTRKPAAVLDHDFPIKELGKIAPYGIYDIKRNEGFVNLGIFHDTVEFVVESIVRWWQTLGRNTYPDASKLSDNGGSNGSRVKLWKETIAGAGEHNGLGGTCLPFPPGTSKWNKIEHRMFCFISKNWRGRLLISIETVIELIANTTTAKGLKIICMKAGNKYELGRKVSDKELAELNITGDIFHGDWNYIISPKV